MKSIEDKLKTQRYLTWNFLYTRNKPILDKLEFSELERIKFSILNTPLQCDICNLEIIDK